MSLTPQRPELENDVANLKERVRTLESLTPASNIEITDGTIDISPTSLIRVLPGLVLTNPNPGEADLAAPLAVEYLSADNPSVGAGTFGDLAFTHVSGDSILDLTTPTTPTIQDDGDYEIAGMLRTLENVTSGYMVRGLLIANSAEDIRAGGAFTAGAAAAGVAYINVSCALKLSAGDIFGVTATNEDTISHHFLIGLGGFGLMAVTKR